MRIDKKIKIKKYIKHIYHHVMSMFIHNTFSEYGFYLKPIIKKYTLFTPLIRRVTIIFI